MKNPFTSVMNKLGTSPKARLITMISLFVVVVLLAATVIVLAVNLASSKDNEPEPVTPGAESGLYYYDSDGKEYTLQLHSGNQFTLYDGETKVGTYTVAEDGALAFTFAKKDDGTATGKVEDNVVTLNYNGAEARFLRKVYYSVSFSTDGGSAISAITVVNGKYASHPSDPVKADHVFLGWYSDAACKTPFVFASSAITSDITLYARWAHKAPGVPEYTVSFEGASVNAMSTIGGKLYGLPTPEKDGYTFGGWWISSGNSAEKLTAKYVEGTSFSEDDTLYALWIPDNSITPIVEVSADKVSWDRIDGAIHYSLKIYDPSGSLVYEGNETGTSYKYDFTTAGEYKIALSASVNGTTTEVTERYYTAKALGSVYQFEVVEPSILVFNKVPNAEEYILNIVCGNSAHNHSAYNNGNSTVYNFANCEMVAGGISFTVTARAEGFADSVSETFVFERKLDSVTDIAVNNDVVTWKPVDGASEYIVTITVGGNTYTETIGTYSYDLKYFAGGEISVSVKAIADGYVSPEATVYTFEKASLAAPSQSSITVSGSVISWEAVAGENVSYIVYINGNQFPTSTNSINLGSTPDFTANAGDVLNISVSSVVGTAVSTPSDSVNVNYGVFAGYLTYNNHILSWSAVLGIEGQYEVMVGNSASTFVDGTSATIAFTQGGVNTIAVRFVSDNYTSDWLRTNLNVHTITFDTRLGSAVAPIYFVTGDDVTLPTTSVRTGYTFTNWYDSTDVNGKLITSGRFDYTDDLILYAHWTANTYHGIVSGAPSDVEGVENGAKLPAVYDSAYTFPVLESDAGQFIGWFTGANGTGLQLTNDEGASLANWTFSEDTNVYPHFASNLISFVERTDGTWAVTSGPDVASVSKIVVPATYQGKAVTAILENAFKGNATLKTISIPDTVDVIGVGAFNTSYYLETIIVREIEGTHKRIFSSENGALIKNDLGTDYLEFVPRRNAGLNGSGTFTVPSKATAIRNKAFQYTNLITKVIIPANVTTIAEQAFFHATALTEIEFMSGGSNALTIENGAFYDTERVTTIKLPARLASVDAVETFDALPKLANIYVEDGGEFYGAIDGILTNGGAKNTFIYAPVLWTGKLDVPVGVTAIGANAFANRAGITSVNIPNWVTSIGNYAFANSTNISSVTIKGGKIDNLTIGAHAFAGCTNNITLNIEGGNTLDVGALIIGDYAFANNAKLSATNIAENANVTSIGAYAFSGCSAITAVTIQATTATIGERAYAQCTGVGNVTFAEGVNAEFGAFVFEGCQKLRSISLPASLESFDGSIFAGCNNIEAIEVAYNNPNLSDADGVLYDKDFTTVLYYPKAKELNLSALPNSVTKIGKAAFQANVTIKTLTIPARITEIGDYAFENCVNLTSLAFDTDTELTTLGNSAFANCTSLATVTLPAGLKDIGDRAFYLTSIAAITLPDSVTSVGAYAFAKTNITAITIPGNVATVKEGAFSDCVNLKTITVAAGEAALSLGSLTDTYGVFEGSATSYSTTVTLAERVTVIGSRAFYNVQKVTSLKNIETTKLTAIGDWAFYYNKFSNNITLPEGLISIGAHAFENCQGTNFKSLVIPSTVTEIGEAAFQKCTKITAVTFSEGAAEAENLALKLNKNLFVGCTALLTVDLPSHLDEAYEVTSTAGGLQLTTFSTLFTGCSKLTKVSVHDDCEKYGDINGIFGEKNSSGVVTRLIYCPLAYATAAVTIPHTVTKVDNGAFNGVTKITSITFEDTPEWDGTPTLVLGNENYSGYTSGDEAYPVIKGTLLTSVTLPAQLKTIGGVAFYGWAPKSGSTVLPATLTINENAKIAFIGQRAISGTNVTGLAMPKVAEISPYAISGNAMMETLSFAAGTSFTEIPSNAFYNNKALKAFEVPASVTVIGPNAFSGTGAITNNSLASITFAPGCNITTIGDKAFGNIPITSFTFPESIETIGTSIFQSCSKLEEITLNTKMSNLYASDGTNIVADAINLARIIVPEGNQYLESDEHGVLYNKGKTQLLYCSPVNEIAEYKMPDTVTSIEDSALALFGAYGNVAKVTLSKNLLTIGENAFKGAYIDSLVIPASVQRIESGAFEGIKSITSITFEDDSSLVYIGANAFSGCEKLASIDIPDGVTEIGASAFMNCRALASVDLPASLTTLVDSTFSGCSALASITLKEGLESITGDVFSGCSALTSISFPASLKSITTNRSGVFANCSSLESVNFPAGASITTISANAFVNCAKLTKFILPATVVTLNSGMLKGCANVETIEIIGNIESIPAGMFSGFANLKNINIPATVTEIGDSAFEGCTSLQTITLPSALTKIGESAFRGCTALNGIEIGANVSEIGNYAFENCTALASVVFSPDNAIKSLGTAYDVETPIFRNTTALKSIALPDSITTIGARLFENSGIESIELPASLTAISEYAFAGCASLESLTVPSAVKDIHSYAFLDCANLASIDIAFGVESFGTAIFMNCTSLESVTIPSTINNMVGNPFINCPALTTINFDSANTDYVFEGNMIFDSDRFTLVYFSPVIQGAAPVLPSTVRAFATGAFYGASITEFAIPATLTEIPDILFMDCKNLASITIPNNITRIGDRAFMGCSSLLSVQIPQTVTEIGEYAFAGCTALKSVTFDERKTAYTIGAHAFDGATSLTGITLQEGLAELTPYMFANTGLLEFTFPESITNVNVEGVFYGSAKLATVNMHNNVGDTLGLKFFMNCASLNNFTFPDSITRLGELIAYSSKGDTNGDGYVSPLEMDGYLTNGDSYAFAGCTSLESINFKNVYWVGAHAFEGCTSLVTVTSGTYLSIIGDYAFANCTALKTADFSASTKTWTYGRTEQAADGLTYDQNKEYFKCTTTIGQYAFQNCSLLESVKFAKSGPYWSTTIGTGIFEGCTLLTKANITNLPNNWKNLVGLS